MNKVVCAICGTSFPKNAEKCPICGYVQDKEKAVAVAAVAADTATGSYSHVKGGRFSKSNVKKRTQSGHAAAEQTASSARRSSSKKKKKSNVGTVIVIALLLLAILAVLGYITLRFLLPNDFLYEGLGIFGSSQQTEEPENNPEVDPAPEETDATASLDCTSVQLAKNDIQLNGIGTTYKLVVSLEPAETKDTVSYSSSDESVVSVSEDGTITAVAEGGAVITVTCGSVSTECFVACIDPEPENQPIKFTLNRKEITFKAEGESWIVYDGEIAPEEIIWFSNDNTVATIEEGKVVAVGNGETTIQGLYGGQSASCVIRCEFEEDTEEESSNVSEATGGDDDKTYELHNPYGYAEDVTIRPGEEFTLMLVDEDDNEVTDAQWTVENGNVCTFSGNVVTGSRSGMTKVIATYKGKTYTCIVRVL